MLGVLPRLFRAYEQGESGIPQSDYVVMLRHMFAAYPDERPGIALRAWRKGAGMSQREAAALLGVHHTFLSQLETGTRGAREAALCEAIENICGIDPIEWRAIPDFRDRTRAGTPGRAGRPKIRKAK